MKLAFYKASGNLIDKAIRLVTLGKYSHCELIFSDGQWFSADAWENKCRFKDGSKFNLQNWDFIDFNCDEQLAKLFCKNIEGAKYDFRAILLWLIPMSIDNSKKWYCSEVCNSAIAFPHEKISPSSLYKKIVNINT